MFAVLAVSGFHFAADAVYHWLDENTYQYAFIKRYPAEKNENHWN